MAKAQESPDDPITFHTLQAVCPTCLQCVTLQLVGQDVRRQDCSTFQPVMSEQLKDHNSPAKSPDKTSSFSSTLESAVTRATCLTMSTL